MSYQVPPQWEHGDIPIATLMNKYSDALNAIHDSLGDVKKFYLVAAAVAGEDNDAAEHVHRARWLWVSGPATIVDPAAVEDDVSISADEEPTRFDTQSVNWLTFGKRYRVTGCSWSMETRTP